MKKKEKRKKNGKATARAHRELNPLRAWRRSVGWRMADVAQDLGVSIGTIRNWEGGSHMPSPRHMEKIAWLMMVSRRQDGTTAAEILTQRWRKWHKMSKR